MANTYYEEKVDKLMDRLNKKKSHLSKKDVYEIKDKIVKEKIENFKQLDNAIYNKQKKSNDYYEMRFEDKVSKLNNYINKKSKNYDVDDFDDKVSKGYIKSKKDVDLYLKRELK